MIVPEYNINNCYPTVEEYVIFITISKADESSSPHKLSK